MLFSKKKHTYNKFWNQPEGTQDTVRISDIIIPKCYLNTQPKQHKLDRVEDAYISLGHLDKPITVVAETNERGKANKFILVDEYTRFIFARNYGINKIPVKYISMEDYIELNAIKEKSWHEYVNSKIEERRSKKSNMKQ